MARRAGSEPPRRRHRRRPGERRADARPVRARSDLPGRVLVAVPAIAFAILVVWAGGIAFALTAILLGLVCLHELFRMYAGARPVRLAAMLGLVVMALGAYLGGEWLVLLGVAAAVPLTFLLALPAPGGAPVTLRTAITTLGVLWVGVPVAHAVLLRELAHGGGIMLLVLVATFAGDTGAYLGGRYLGRRLLAPRISPHKTVEGLLIGILTAVLAAWIVGLYQDWLSDLQALVLGAAAGFAAPLGDLFESRVKRDAAVKDAGGLFGAHGGALDRLDGALFSVVAGHYVWLAML